VKIGSAVWAAPILKELPKKRKNPEQGAHFTYMPEKTLQPIFIKIGPFQLAPDVITPSKFDF